MNNEVLLREIHSFVSLVSKCGKDYVESAINLLSEIEGPIENEHDYSNMEIVKPKEYVYSFDDNYLLKQIIYNKSERYINIVPASLLERGVPLFYCACLNNDRMYNFTMRPIIVGTVDTKNNWVVIKAAEWHYNDRTCNLIRCIKSEDINVIKNNINNHDDDIEEDWKMEQEKTYALIENSYLENYNDTIHGPVSPYV